MENLEIGNCGNMKKEVEELLLGCEDKLKKVDVKRGWGWF